MSLATFFGIISLFLETESMARISRDECFDCRYLEEEQFSEFLHASEEVGRLLGGILAKPETFCLKSDI